MDLGISAIKIWEHIDIARYRFIKSFESTDERLG